MHVTACFDETTQASVAAAADTMAQQSPFQPQSVPLHARLGRLNATAEEARASVVDGHQIVLTGQFLEWTIRDETLQLHAELDTSFLETQLAAAGVLFEPAAAPLLATVGSVAAIEPSQRAAFLDAVKSAFPCNGGQIQAMVDCHAADDSFAASQPTPEPFPPPAERRLDKAALQSRLKELQHEIISRRRAVGRAAPSLPAKKDPKRGAGEAASAGSTAGSAMEVEPTGRTTIKKNRRRPRPRPPSQPPSQPSSRRVEVVGRGPASTKSRHGPRRPAGRGGSRPGANPGRGAGRAGGAQ